jgi:hypothetical protein
MAQSSVLHNSSRRSKTFEKAAEAMIMLVKTSE